jgi:hypothetical protein
MCDKLSIEAVFSREADLRPAFSFTSHKRNGTIIYSTLLDFGREGRGE